MDRHPNFPEDGEAPWHQADDRYERGGWNPPVAGTPRGRAEDRYRVPEPRGHDNERLGQDQRGAGRDGQGPGGSYDGVDDSGRFRAPHAGPTQRVDAYGAARPDHPQAGYPERPGPPYSPDPLGGPRADPLGGPPDPRGDPHRDPNGDPLGGAHGDPLGYRTDGDAFGYRTDGDPPGHPTDGDPGRFHTQPLDRAALRRPDHGDRVDPAAGAGMPGGGPATGRPGADRPGKVYRTGRPLPAAVIIIVLAVCELVALQVFAEGLFGGALETSGTVSGMLLLVGLPVTAYGGYALAAGGAAPGAGAQAWLRAPLAYLWVGLALLVAAGAAA